MGFRLGLVLALALVSQLALAHERHGAVVMARTAEALPAAKALARAAYRKPSLRPEVDEPTARIVAGEPPPEAPEGAPADAKRDKLIELAHVRQAALEAADPAVATRLLASLGRELEVELVVVVESGEHGPVARALTVEEGRFLPMALSPKAPPPPDPAKPDAPPPEIDWTDAVPLLEGLAQPPPPPVPGLPPTTSAAAVAKPGEGAPAAPPKGKGKSDTNLLTSPWFWGGLAAVVTVGVTVLVLSQTALNQPTKVDLGGHVDP